MNRREHCPQDRTQGWLGNTGQQKGNRERPFDYCLALSLENTLTENTLTENTSHLICFPSKLKKNEKRMIRNLSHLQPKILINKKFNKYFA